METINLNEYRAEKLIAEGMWGLVTKVGVDSIEPLIDFILDENNSDDDRNSAFESLDSLNARKGCSVEPLIARLNHPDPNIRLTLIRALSNLHDPRSFDAFINLLGDKDAKVRKFAIGSLIRLGNKRAVDPIKKMLKDEDEEVRITVYYALRTLNTKKKLPADPLENIPGFDGF